MVDVFRSDNSLIPRTQADGVAPARPAVTRQVCDGTTRLLLQHGWTPVHEFTLANGRRADIAALDRTGSIAFAEVKSGIEDFRSDQKWQGYLPYCDHFYFAVSSDFPMTVLEDLPCGLIVADQFGAEIIRPAPLTKLVAARRKAVTLLFARHAAQRALSVADTDFGRYP